MDQTGTYAHYKDSIYPCHNRLPGFGGGNDLYMSDEALKTRHGNANIGYTYDLPPDYRASLPGYIPANKLLAGTLYFIPDEVEVFYETT